MAEIALGLTAVLIAVLLAMPPHRRKGSPSGTREL